jgi:hypothetical protein
VSNHAFLTSAQEMIKQFYEKLLPRQGVYCIGELDRSLPKGKQMRHHYAETIEEFLDKVEGVNNRKHDCYITPGSFQQYKRAASECVWHKSLFIDFDVSAEKAEEGKAYATKDEAIAALDKFLDDSGLPPPIRINSGIGLHAYWVFDEDIPADEFLPYAKKFKSFCRDLLPIFDEEATPADLARFMRVVGSTNYRPDPPAPCEFLTTDFGVYSFPEFKEFLGEPEVESSSDVLARVSKGLSDEDRKMLGIDNFKYNFEKIVIRSIEGDGCAQVNEAVVNPNSISRNLWAGILTIAVRCDDGDTAIHKISEDYDNYDPEETYKVAHSFDGCRRCDWFENNADRPDLCGGCKFKGRISSPIQLGKELRIAAEAPDEEDAVWKEPDTEKVSQFPASLRPFVRGENGGIFFQPPPTVDKKGVKHQEDAVMLLPHDFYPIRRLYSPLDGECMLMRLVLPHDPVREFLLPIKTANTPEEVKKLVSQQGVLCEASLAPKLSSYVTKWGQYMINTYKADLMRMQMGWTENYDAFVIGSLEITKDGQELESPASPYVKNIAKYLKKAGTFEKWKESADALNQPQMEFHAFALLCGFGSPLMRFTSTSGVTISLHGESGAAKTGALYGALSIFGSPKELSVFDATPNGMVGRYLSLHNIMLGVDETSNADPKVMSQLTHSISHGKAKIRMQASVNAEREHELSASLIAILTTNQALYAKFESIKASPDGEVARLIEFTVKQPDILKGVEGGRTGRAIFDPFNLNYGHAGPMFIKEVFRVGNAKILELIEHWQARFEVDFGDDSAYRFYKNLVGVVFAAGDISNAAGITSYDLDRVYKCVVEEMVNIRDKVVKVNNLDYRSMLGDFMNKYIPNTLVINMGKVTMEPRGSLVIRIEPDKDLTQVSKTELKKYLTDRQVSVREFESELRKQGVLVDVKKGRLTTGWKSAVANDPAYLYWFKSKIPDEFFTETDDDA